MEGIQSIEFGEDKATKTRQTRNKKRNLGFQQDNKPKSLILLMICKLW